MFEFNGKSNTIRGGIQPIVEQQRGHAYFDVEEANNFK